MAITKVNNDLLTLDAAQPTITSVGTLTGLTVGGTLSSGDITIAVDDTPTLNFNKASSADVLASINVTTDAGSGGKLAIQTKRNGNTPVDRLTIDDDGRVTMPYQPAFFAYRNGNYSSAAPNEKVAINVKDYDIGSNYSTANARFTAPVAGRYFFTGNVNCYAVITDQFMMATLVINNAAKVYGNRIPSRGGADWNVTVSGVVNMAVGDYAEIWSHSGDSARNFSSGAWNTFSGFLIG